MIHAHVFLALAAIAVVLVVLIQDWLIPALRQESISAGLSAPYHWYLDASYVVLSTALALAFYSAGPWARALSIIGAVALILTAITDTFASWVDSFTSGQHSKWHSIFTAVTFGSALALQCFVDRGALMWSFTAANVAVPAITYGLSKKSTYAEKTGVLVLALWLVAV